MLSDQKNLPSVQELVQSVLDRPLTEEDALLWMVLLHTHRICLRSSGSANGDSPRVLYPETRRGVAEIIADLWPERGGERDKYVYSYHQYNTRTPYEDLSELPSQTISRVHRIRDQLAREPRIQAVVEDD